MVVCGIDVFKWCYLNDVIQVVIQNYLGMKNILFLDNVNKGSDVVSKNYM